MRDGRKRDEVGVRKEGEDMELELGGEGGPAWPLGERWRSRGVGSSHRAGKLEQW